MSMEKSEVFFDGWTKAVAGDVIVLLLRPYGVHKKGETVICSRPFFEVYIGKRRGAVLGIKR